MASRIWVPVIMALALVGSALSGCGLMRGSDYPTSDITITVPYAAGGVCDGTARVLGQQLETALGKKVVIVNKAGASATLGTSDVVNSKPDGYNLGITSASALTVQPQVSKLPYNSTDDYTMLLKAIDFPTVWAVKADAPWKNFQEFMDDAKKRPGQIRVAMSGTLVSEDLLLYQFEKVTGTKFTHVPFTGGGVEAATNVLGGHVESVLNFPGIFQPYIQAGTMRNLAIMNTGRLEMFKDTPFIEEMGIKLTTPGTMYFFIGPKGMDKAVTEKLVTTFKKGTESDAYKKFVKDNGGFANVKGPEDAVKEVKNYWDVYGGLIKEFDIGPKK